MSENNKKADAAGEASVAILLKNHVVSNPISVITAVGSLVGGLLILIYLVSIQYFPSDMDVSTIGFLLAGSAITGTFLTIFFALYLVLPGLVYRHVLNDASQEKSESGQRQPDISSAASGDGQQQPEVGKPNLLSQSSVIWLLDIPFAVIFVLAIILFIFGWNGVQWWIFFLGASPLCFFLVRLFFINSKIYSEVSRLYKDCMQLIGKCIGSIVSKVMPLCLARITKHLIDTVTKAIPLDLTRVTKQSIGKSIGYFVASLVTAFIPWLLILLLISQYAKESSDEESVWFAFFVMGLCVIFVNHWVVIAKKWWFLAIAAPAILLVFFAMTQQISLVPKVVVRTLAFGNMPNVTLMLDKQGCQIASQYVRAPKDLADIIQPTSHFSKDGKKNQDEKDESSMVCRLSLVNLKWRIGNEYFVDATDAKLFPVIGKKSADDDKKIKSGNSLKQVEQVSVGPQSVSVELPLLPASGFTISSTHVLSWSMAEQKKPVTQ